MIQQVFLAHIVFNQVVCLAPGLEAKRRLLKGHEIPHNIGFYVNPPDHACDFGRVDDVALVFHNINLPASVNRVSHGAVAVVSDGYSRYAHFA